MRLHLFPYKSMKFPYLSKLCRLQDRHASQYQGLNSGYVVCYCGIIACKVVLRKEWFEKAILVPFEDTYFYAPMEYDKYLRTYYGDYMILPPEDKRVPYHRPNVYWNNI